MTPKQRGAGQTGGGGYRNHGQSMGRSVSRGGRPHAGGGGGGSKGNGCAVVAFGALGTLVYGTVEIVRAVI